MNANAKEIEENVKPIVPWVAAMQKAEPKFIELAEIHGAVNWKSEANYAAQAIKRNEILQKCSPQSIVDAIINVAAIGLSLSPADQLAYLIPRKGVCVLDISYKGLIKLVTDSGNCDYVRADIVREQDNFIYHGPAAAPEVSLNPFSADRGAVVGAYAIAKLATGDVLCEVMTAEELMAIENASMSKTGPWKGAFKSEMCKKSVIKRICKTIPRTEQSGRLHKAIEVLNDHEGIEIESELPPLSYDAEQKERFDAAIKAGDKSELWHMSRIFGDAWQQLHRDYVQNAPNKKKGVFRKAIDDLTIQGRELFVIGAAELVQAHEKDDHSRALETLADFDNQRSSLYEQLPEDVLLWVEYDVLGEEG